jgi:hypothetical protein
VGNVRVDRPPRQEELLADFSVRETFAHECNDTVLGG